MQKENHVNNKRKILFLIIFLTLSILHLLIPILNHYFFRTYAYDYGVYNFAFYDYAHLQISACPVYHNLYTVSFLQDHFSLTLMVLSPLYWLFQGVLGTYSLLFIQWLFIVFGAFCTYKYIENKTSNYKTALFALVYYFIIFNRFSAYQADCNLSIIGAAVIPVFMYFFETQKIIPTLIAYLFLLVNREDFSLTLAFICLFFMIGYRKQTNQFKFATILLLFSVAVFCTTFSVIIPWLETADKKFSLFNYSALGETPGEALSFIVRHPIKTLCYLFMNHTDDPAQDNIKSLFYLVYGLSGGILLLFRPMYLICLIPLIAKKMFNDDSLRWGYDMYYSIEIASILPILVFSVISKFKADRWQNTTSVLVCIVTAIATYYCMTISTRWNVSNSKYNIFSTEFYIPTNNIWELNFLLKKIPDEASVSADGKVLPHLAFREKIYLFPKIEDADYLCLSTTSNPYPISREEYNTLLKKLLNTGSCRIDAAMGDFILLKKAFKKAKAVVIDLIAEVYLNLHG